ncbi:MAG: DUF2314 domain-containing protein [Verrucomicrobiota bacterium]
MKRRAISVACALILSFFAVGCSNDGSMPETLVSSYNESEMDAAIEKAKATVGDFVEALAIGEADEFSIKAPISDSNGTEHFWISDVAYADGKFTGLIANDPGVVKNVEYGQSWSVEKNEISDWMFMRGEMIHGGFTIEALLASYPEEEANLMRSKLVR